MQIFLTILHVIVCFTLILVILLQAGRGQGLTSSSFGSGNVQSVLGTGAADFLTKATTGAAIMFLLTCIGLDIIEVQKSRSLMELSEKSAPINVEQIQEALDEVKKDLDVEEGESVAQEVADEVDKAAESATS